MALSIDQKRLKATKFPPEFDKKVDIEKVNIDLMKKWIANRITTILGDEDDIVVETCYNLVEQNQFVSRLLYSILRLGLIYAAQNQGDTNPTRRVFEQGHGAFLQRAMGPDVERPR
jgi:restriction endonuclease S subunit